MGSNPWKNRYRQDHWEILCSSLSVFGTLKAMPSTYPICNSVVEVRSGIRRSRARSRQDGRFYWCNLIDDDYDLTLTGIDAPLPDILRIQLTTVKSEASPYKLKFSEPLDFDLNIEGAVVMNGWICALHFEIKNQHISEINQWNKEVTHA
jgi:hypothetical protein